MPMKMPFGPNWFQGIEWDMPNLLMAGVPGFERVATTLMKMTLKHHGVAGIPKLRGLCIEAEVKLLACQVTVDLFGREKAEFIPGVTEWAGAATCLTCAQGADITLFVRDGYCCRYIVRTPGPGQSFGGFTAFASPPAIAPALPCLPAVVRTAMQLRCTGTTSAAGGQDAGGGHPCRRKKARPEGRASVPAGAYLEVSVLAGAVGATGAA
jgi:predicted peroxiredoxin